MSPRFLMWPGDGSWAPALDAAGVRAPPPVRAAAIGEEVRAGPSFRGRHGRLFRFLLPIDDDCNRVLNPKSKGYEVLS